MSIFNGDDAPNILSGGPGDDILNGLGGNDTLDGGEGSDTLDGGTGNDLITVGSGDTANGGAGNDTFDMWADHSARIDGGTGYDTLAFISANLTRMTLSGIEQLNADFPSLTAEQLGTFKLISGYDSNVTEIFLNLTRGGAANVHLADSLSYATFYGSEGADIITFDATATALLQIHANGGNDRFIGGAGEDEIYGDAGNDSLTGGGGWDMLDGGEGIDTLNGGTGNDSLKVGTGDTANGDADDDLFSLMEGLPARIDGGTGEDALATIDNFDISDLTFSGIERLYSHNTFLTATQLDGFKLIAGENIGENTSELTLTQGGIANLDLDDFIRHFRLTGSNQADLITFLATERAGLNVTAGDGNDMISGGRGADRLYGEAGNDTLQGGLGTDALDGGDGRDTALYANSLAAVTVDLRVTGQQNTGGAGIDTLSSIENLRGSAFDDALTGGDGANRLLGMAGDDSLTGGAGADALVGGAGVDRLDGGAGADLFDFNLASESSVGASDVIVAFEGAGAAAGDRIDLSGIDANALLAGDNAFVFGSGTAGGLSLVASGSDTLIRGNTDADADFEFAVLIADGATPASAYTAADFVL